MTSSSFLRDYFRANGVPVYPEHKSKKIRDNEVIIEDKEGYEKAIPCNSEIMSVGYTSTPLKCDSKKSYVIGGANSVGNLRSAIWGAWDVAM